MFCFTWVSYFWALQIARVHGVLVPLSHPPLTSVFLSKGLSFFPKLLWERQIPNRSFAFDFLADHPDAVVDEHALKEDGVYILRDQW